MPLIESALLYAVWNEFRRAVDPGLTLALSALQPLIDEQVVGVPLIRSPVFISITERDTDTFTLVARGRLDLFDNAFTEAFFDLQLVCGRRLVITSLLTPPLDVRQWRVAAGQVTIGKQGVWHATHGLVRTDDRAADGTSIVSWGGRGRLELEQLGFMVDLMIISDGRGFVGALSLELPVMIPLGSSGLGLNGLSGLLAMHFAPRLRDPDGRDVLRPDARDYVRWALAAREDEGLALWRPARTSPESCAFGLGLHFGTLFDSGRTIRVRNAGLALVFPQGVLLFGGTGILVDTFSLRFHAVLGYDAESQSLALGGAADLEYPEEHPLLTIDGPSEGYFSFRHPELSYFNVGTREEPVQASFNLRLLTSLVSATAYFQIDAHRVALGARVTATGGLSLPLRVAEAVMVISVQFEAMTGWNPGQIELLASVSLEMRLALLFGLLRFSQSITATVLARYPRPAVFRVTLEVRFETTGLPPLVAPLSFEVVAEDRSPPVLRSPLLCGFELDAAGVRRLVPGGASAFLPASGRSWVVLADARDATQDARPIWPDAVLIIPFGERALDTTGSISGTPPGLVVRGGYEVVHRLTSLTLVDDATPAVPIRGVTAVWAEGPAGTSGRLMVLGDDPFAAAARFERAAPTGRDGAFVVQDFGLGETEVVAVGESRTWNDLHVLFPLSGQVWDGLLPSPDSRVLRTPAMVLRWSDASGPASSIRVDTVVLNIVGDAVTRPSGITVVGRLRGATASTERPRSLRIGRGPLLEGGLRLWDVNAQFAAPVAQVDVAITGNRGGLLVVSVAWLAVRESTSSRTRLGALAPGRYTLAMAGTTSGTPPVDRFPLPAAVPVPWGVTFGFTVEEPDTLDEYVLEWSVGDGRAPGGRETASWNPTRRREGFPWYTRYPIAMRPRVPWVLDLWPGATLELCLISDGETSGWVPMRRRELGTTEHMHDARGRAWILANGGRLPRDVELLADPPAIPPRGAPTDRDIAVLVRAVRTGAPPRFLHTWPARQSRFRDFAEHVTPASTVVSTGFSPSRMVEVAPADRAWRPGDPVSLTRGGMPTGDWVLAAEVQRSLGAIDSTASARFMRLAHLGAAGPVPRWPIDDAGLVIPVPATRVDALLDITGRRVIALWWRTPEPLDWRRLEATIRVRHPVGSPYGPSFTASLAAVPSLDGSAAFLVAMRDGQGVSIPRGSVQIDCIYHMEREGLVRLPLATLLGEWVHLNLELTLGTALGSRP